MKHRISRISISLMTMVMVGLSASTALAITRPFHLLEHGTLTVDRDGELVADGTGTATQLGRFTLHRTATLKPTTEGELEVDGQATLTAANRDQLEASIKGTLSPDWQGCLDLRVEGRHGPVSERKRRHRLASPG